MAVKGFDIFNQKLEKLTNQKNKNKAILSFYLLKIYLLG